MELAARAGFDPAAGVTLWKKMSAAARGAPPQWMSSHPNSESRIALIKEHLKDVQPLYEKARVAKAGGKLPPTLRKEEGETVQPKSPNTSNAPGPMPRQFPPAGPGL
jgi:predicted Zn-dependent protease